MPHEFYQEDEAEAILRIAAQKTNLGVPRERLLANAAELGISAETVEEAEEIYLRRREESELREKFDRYEKRGFSGHLTAYAVTVSFLFLLNLLVDREGGPWFLFPAFGWGIGLAIHAVLTFFSKGESRERRFERWAWRHQGGPVASLSPEQFRAMSMHDRHRHVHVGVRVGELSQGD